MMNDGNYQFIGMHMLWWVLWMFMLVWIFVSPYNIPGQRIKKDTPLDILRKRFALGEITIEEFHEKRAFINSQ